MRGIDAAAVATTAPGHKPLPRAPWARPPGPLAFVHSSGTGNCSCALAVPLNQADHCLGPAHAPVRVVEYGDFHCASSFAAYRTMKLLHAHYGSQMRFAFRHAPLIGSHPFAGFAAEAAEAAAAQGRFWEMHDHLFDQHDDLFDRRAWLEPTQFLRYAEDLHLDLAPFEAALTGRAYRLQVAEHLAGGRRSGVTRTAAFFVDSERVDVASGFGPLVRAIELSLHSVGRYPTAHPVLQGSGRWSQN